MTATNILLRRILPLAITVLALGLAFTRVDAGKMLQTAAGLPAIAIVTVCLALTAQTLLASLRLKFVAGDFDRPLRLADALAATTSGQLAGSFFFQIIGQIVARGAVLARVGMPIAATVLMTGYERVVAALVSFALALFGGWYLFGAVSTELQAGGDDLLKGIAGLLLVGLSGAVFAWGRQAWIAIRPALRLRPLLALSRVTLLSAAIQASTMIAYVAAARSLAPALSFVDLIAATSLVMLAASIPVSLAGWGPREVSAIYVLGAIHMPAEAALLVAVLLGLAQISVTAALALPSLVSTIRPALERPAAAPGAATFDAVRFLSWFIPLFAASTVFFQVYVPIGKSRLDVNLADTVVLFGGALLLLRLRPGVAPRPGSRLPRTSFFVLMTSLVIVLSCLHGWIIYGWISWAFVNRLFGWLICLAYAATGALLVVAAGSNGRQMLIRTFVAAGLAVATMNLALMTADFYDLLQWPTAAHVRLAGFAQNPNAFAFQLLLVIACIVALGRSGQILQPWLPLALALTALFFTGSRAGEATCVILIAMALYLKCFNLRELLIAGALAALGVSLVTGDIFRLAIEAVAYCAQEISHLAQTTMHHALPGSPQMRLVQPSSPQTGLSGFIGKVEGGYPASDPQHFETLVLGVKMFLAHPVFGAGLGAFVATSPREGGQELLIHSTPLWLLAETGVIGFAAFATPALWLMSLELRRRATVSVSGIILILCLLALGTMSVVHELLYQRAFWLILGAALVSIGAETDVEPLNDPIWKLSFRKKRGLSVTDNQRPVRPAPYINPR